ncbi:MAG: ComEC family competence protein, partial [Bacteroidales bacterium]|nr:ComEC family competence protein [Bacteroidales bacterium]
MVTERPNSFKTIAKVKLAGDKNKPEKTTGKIMVYFEKGENAEKLNYGDLIVLNGRISEIPSPRNPGEFNYQRYLSNKGIYHSVFLKSENWGLIHKRNTFSLKAMGINIREKLLVILKDNGISGDEFAVASAILLGYDENLDAELKRQFSGAGAMHILCVSGLHVGIVYVILNGLLFFMNRKRSLRVIKVFILILLIWFYALITGFSPSVLRASTMFSFIILGRSVKRKTNIYNMLAASAFLLLVINPYILWEVGFQLSYLAVTGIVLLFKPVYGIFIPRNIILDKVWQITVVSLAATVATFPLSIYYFDQFPNLFLLTNLVAIPASILILYSGLAVIGFSFIPAISNLFGTILSLILKGLTISVGWIEGLSFATTRGIYITSIELILILLILASLYRVIIAKNKMPGTYLVVLLFILSISFTNRRISNLHQEKIVVYHVNRFPAIEFIKGKKSVLLTDSLLIQNPTNLEYAIRGNQTKQGIEQNTPISIGEEEFKNPMLFKKKD